MQTDPIVPIEHKLKSEERKSLVILLRQAARLVELEMFITLSWESILVKNYSSLELRVVELQIVWSNWTWNLPGQFKIIHTGLELNLRLSNRMITYNSKLKRTQKNPVALKQIVLEPSSADLLSFKPNLSIQTVFEPNLVVLKIISTEFQYKTVRFTTSDSPIHEVLKFPLPLKFSDTYSSFKMCIVRAGQCSLLFVIVIQRLWKRYSEFNSGLFYQCQRNLQVY